MSSAPDAAASDSDFDPPWYTDDELAALKSSSSSKSQSTDMNNNNSNSNSRVKPTALFPQNSSQKIEKNERSFILKTMDSGYRKRTQYNCTESDFTVAFAFDFTTGGEKLTFNSAGKFRIYQVPFDDFNSSHLKAFVEKYKAQNSKTLHIAGNGSYTLCKHWGSMCQEKADKAVYKFLKAALKYIEVSKVYSGGQTGVDMAGIKAALKLGIPVEVTMPKNYLIRNQDGQDVELGTEYEVLKYLMT